GAGGRIPIALLLGLATQAVAGDVHHVDVDVLVGAGAQDGAAVVGGVPGRGEGGGPGQQAAEIVAGAVAGGRPHIAEPRGDGQVSGRLPGVDQREGVAADVGGGNPPAVTGALEPRIIGVI